MRDEGETLRPIARADRGGNPTDQSDQWDLV
jgi:hypothetical protein